MSDYFQPSFSYAGDTGKVKGSDTSEAHAGYEKKRASSVQKTVLDCIKDSFYRGMTSKEVEEVTGLPHQTVSSTIRNLELDNYDPKLEFAPYNYGRIVKLKKKRDNQHAYIAAFAARDMNSRYGSEHIHHFIARPTPRRSSYKKRHQDLFDKIQTLLSTISEEHPNEVAAAPIMFTGLVEICNEERKEHEETV